MSTLGEVHELLDHLLEKKSDDVGMVMAQMHLGVDSDHREETINLIKRQNCLKLEDLFESGGEVGFVVSVY